MIIKKSTPSVFYSNDSSFSKLTDHNRRRKDDCGSARPASGTRIHCIGRPGLSFGLCATVPSFGEHVDLVLLLGLCDHPGVACHA